MSNGTERDTAVTQDDRSIILMNTEETSDQHRSIDYMGTGRAGGLDGAGRETVFFPWPEYAGDQAALPDYHHNGPARKGGDEPAAQNAVIFTVPLHQTVGILGENGSEK